MLAVATSEVYNLTTMLSFPRLLKEPVTSSYVVWGAPFATRVGVAQVLALSVTWGPPIDDQVAVCSYSTEPLHGLRQEPN